MNKKNLTINTAAVDFYKAIDLFGNRSKQAKMAFDTLQKLVEPHLEKAIFSVFSGPWGSFTPFSERFFPARQDALQNTYFDLWKKADCKRTRWNPAKIVKGKSASFLTWVQAVAKLKAKDAQRKFNQLKSRFPISLNNGSNEESGKNGEPIETPSNEKSPLENLLIKEQGTVLKKAIDQLSDRQRMVIRQIHLEEKKGKDLATELNISPTSVSNHLKKGLKKLRANVDIQALYFEKF